MDWLVGIQEVETGHGGEMSQRGLRGEKQVYKVTQEAGGSRKVCQRQTVWRGKTKEGQGGPESTHCPPLHPPPRTHLQLPPCHHPTSCQDTAEMGENWEGGKTKEGQREIKEATRCSR